MSSQLDRWKGEFGEAYTRRNVVDWRSRVDGFRQMIPSGTISVCEIGANVGHNLRAIREFVPSVHGCEPNKYARDIARETDRTVCGCSVYDLGIWHRRMKYDLVFTSGVLIHVPPERLNEALTNIHSVAARHILAVEYDSQEDVAVEYRGHEDMLWKRNYGAHYTRLFPDLKLIDVGTAPAGFENATYWLLEK